LRGTNAKTDHVRDDAEHSPYGVSVYRKPHPIALVTYSALVAVIIAG
jgi:hypothetical protein